MGLGDFGYRQITSAILEAPAMYRSYLAVFGVAFGAYAPVSAVIIYI